MNINTIIIRFYLSIVFLFATHILFGQNLCLSTPTSSEGFLTCNKVIATTFAPKLVQFASVCEPDGEDGLADRITKVNWDNDWDSNNNWQSMEEFTDNNAGWDNSPYCYFSVYWSPDEWVIVYSYFYSRDWANPIACGEDEHENDLARVIVVVKRPVTGSEKPEDLLLGFFTSDDDKERCISTDTSSEHFNAEIVRYTDVVGNVAEGVHPIIYSSAGSHHLHTTLFRGYNDSQSDKIGSSNCRPLPMSVINYLPAIHSSVVSDYIPITFDSTNLECNNWCFGYDLSTILECSVHDEYYGLIDVQGGSETLWGRRNDTLLFSSPPTVEQHFLGENGGGIDGTWPFGDQFASAPWTGTMGASPLTIAAKKLSPFDCECNNNENCDDYTITECSYEYNPYICGSYKIETPKNFDYENAWVENPHNDSGNLIAVFTLSAFDGYTGTPSSVNWIWSAPSGDTVNCLLGCSPTEGNRLMLEYVNTTEADILSNPNDYGIFVSADYFECSEIEIYQTLSDVLKGFVQSTPSCNKMVFEVPDDHHIDGNEYEWDFPLYNNLVSVMNDGRRVEFNTQSVIQQTSLITNPSKELAYTLIVSNPSLPSDLDVTGKEQIPECNFGGLPLRVYPNPTMQDDIYLYFEHSGSVDDKINIYVYDHQFRMVVSKATTTLQPSIDVSDLGNGLYFICVFTKDGKMLNEKLCIERR